MHVHGNHVQWEPGPNRLLVVEESHGNVLKVNCSWGACEGHRASGDGSDGGECLVTWSVDAVEPAAVEKQQPQGQIYPTAGQANHNNVLPVAASEDLRGVTPSSPLSPSSSVAPGSVRQLRSRSNPYVITSASPAARAALAELLGCGDESCEDSEDEGERFHRGRRGSFGRSSGAWCAEPALR